MCPLNPEIVFVRFLGFYMPLLIVPLLSEEFFHSYQGEYSGNVFFLTVMTFVAASFSFGE